MSLPQDTEKDSVDESFQYCSRIAREHYENFPVGSWLIPNNRRRYVHAIYAFARMADDFADERSYSEEERYGLLEGWEERLDKCVNGDAEHPIFIALRETLVRFEIPIKLFNNPRLLSPLQLLHGSEKIWTVIIH